MLEVFGLTFSKVGMLLIFIGIGYFLRWHHDLPDDAGRVLSLLCTLVFLRLTLSQTRRRILPWMYWAKRHS